MGHSDGINFTPHTTDGISFVPHAQQGPARTPFSGVHFSDSNPSDGILHGARRGSSDEASDSARIMPVHTNPDGSLTQVGPSAPAGVHVYSEGSTAHPSVGKRKFAHRVHGNHALADISNNPTWNTTLNSAYQQAKQSGLDDKTAMSVAVNSSEHAIKNSGYSGYHNASSGDGSVFLFGDQPIST